MKADNKESVAISQELPVQVHLMTNDNMFGYAALRHVNVITTRYRYRNTHEYIVADLHSFQGSCGQRPASDPMPFLKGMMNKACLGCTYE